MPSKVKNKAPVPAKCHLRTGDKVVLLVGPKAVRGKSGTIIRLFPDDQRALVEGECAQYDTRHIKPDPQNKVEGGRVKRLRPIHVANLALVDPASGKPTRVRHERDANGFSVRVAKKSGHKFEAGKPASK